MSDVIKNETTLLGIFDRLSLMEDWQKVTFYNLYKRACEKRGMDVEYNGYIDMTLAIQEMREKNDLVSIESILFNMGYIPNECIPDWYITNVIGEKVPALENSNFSKIKVDNKFGSVELTLRSNGGVVVFSHEHDDVVNIDVYNSPFSSEYLSPATNKTIDWKELNHPIFSESETVDLENPFHYSDFKVVSNSSGEIIVEVLDKFSKASSFTVSCDSVFGGLSICSDGVCQYIEPSDLEPNLKKLQKAFCGKIVETQDIVNEVESVGGHVFLLDEAFSSAVLTSLLVYIENLKRDGGRITVSDLDDFLSNRVEPNMLKPFCGDKGAEFAHKEKKLMETAMETAKQNILSMGYDVYDTTKVHDSTGAYFDFTDGKNIIYCELGRDLGVSEVHISFSMIHKPSAEFNSQIGYSEDGNGEHCAYFVKDINEELIKDVLNREQYVWVENLRSDGKKIEYFRDALDWENSPLRRGMSKVKRSSEIEGAHSLKLDGVSQTTGGKNKSSKPRPA